MTEVLIFKFPDLKKKNVTIIERKYCELISQYRNGVKLETEVIDWMDSANSFLMSL